MSFALHTGTIRRAGAALMILPVVIYLFAVFFVPIGGMLGLAVRDDELAEVMPLTVTEIAKWDGAGLPGPTAFEAVARDLTTAANARTAGTPARRLSYDDPALRGVISTTARGLKGEFAEGTDWTTRLPELDPAWGQPAVWTAIDRAAGPYSDFFVLAALDLRRDAAGSLHFAPDESRLYLDVLARTLKIAASVTAICLILALPAAYLLKSVSTGTQGLLMIVLLLPLWTSLLVRSAAWMVILQKNGIINNVLLKIGIIDAPLELVFNRTGVLIALSHILLPYAVLPVLGAMRNVSATQTLAASSLGAGPVRTFFSVYLPQIVPGISAAGLLVFILALGYYITPLLLGGPGDQLLPFYIAFNTTQTVNWGLAAALGSILLLATLLLYGVYVKLVGADRIGLG
ncbi:MAG: polyamine ABC transporter substrate-binding protein [Pseudorhodobacter sp. PARRP1]|nr:MAG: polyamine ABC transporter substrate-binding protein [Pseudorhodobacter sp. PARRP1]